MTEEDKLIWNEAIEKAARLLEEFHVSNTGIIHPITIADAEKIRKLKKKLDK